jgi:2-(1,2-epoxy-1,2-dihydrophenyl)acetyl-CoA isomerase
LSEAALYGAADGIATITLNRPETLNAFNADLFACLRRGLDRAEADAKVRAVLITGAGRAFSSGQDLKAGLPAMDDGRLDLQTALERDYNPLALRLVNYPKVTVAALNGPAVGAAANLALACDIIVAAKSAYIQQAFVRIGLVPDAGGTWLLPRIVGAKLALALALSGDRISADEAKAMGLVYRVFEDATFSDDVQAFMSVFAHGPSAAYRLIKRALRESSNRDFASQLGLEAALQQEAGSTGDFKEAVAAFSAKRPPVFNGN